MGSQPSSFQRFIGPEVDGSGHSISAICFQWLASPRFSRLRRLSGLVSRGPEVQTGSATFLCVSVSGSPELVNASRKSGGRVRQTSTN